jgi:serine/threonine-protein kinase HipA
MAVLNIWVGQTHAAILAEAHNTFTLTYTAQWQQSNGFPFSPHLPVDQISSGAQVKNFFSNLLPEGQMLEGLSQAVQVSKYDVFGLLKKVGKDCAGALVLLQEDEHPSPVQTWSTADYQSVEQSQLEQRIQDANAQNTPLIFWENTPRMSLAGVQNKIGIYLNNLDQLFLPVKGAPTSHILKPESSDADKHPMMTANEYFCMQLAEAIGLTVPNTRYLKLPSPVYLIQRYDRNWFRDGQIVRSHQIDGCQALNLPPNLKYEQENPYAAPGASLANVFEFATLCDVPAQAQRQLLQWVLFNYLIGNTDAHAKNISFFIHQSQWDGEKMIDTDGIQVAPFYDLICGVVYGYGEMAQSIEAEFEYALVGKQEWQAFSTQIGIKLPAIQMLAKQMLKKLDQVLVKTANRVSQQTQASIVSDIQSVIERHQSYLEESLLS